MLNLALAGDCEEGTDGRMSEHVFDDFPSASRVSHESLTTASASALAGSYAEARRRAILDFERTYVAELLVRTEGNVSQAARIAKIDRVYLHRLIRRHRPAGEVDTAPKERPARTTREPGERWESLKALWLVPQPHQKKS